MLEALKGTLRRLIRIAVLAFVPFVWSAAGMAQTPQGAKPTVVREAIPSKTAAQWVNFVAEAQGFYARENIQIELLLMDPNNIVHALIGGAIEIGWADTTQLMISAEKGSGLIAFGLSTYRQPYKLMSIPSIKTIADLKGKKIGIAGDVDVYTYVLKQILKKGNLDGDKDVEWVAGGNSTRRLAAITGGGIDAGLFSPPADTRLTKQGFNTLAFTPDYYPNLTLSAEAARRDWAEANGNVLRSVLRAEANALHWLSDPANKERAIAILVEAIGSNSADAEEAYVYYSGIDVWKNTCVNESGLVNVVKILRLTQQVTSLTEDDVIKRIADSRWCVK